MAAVGRGYRRDANGGSGLDGFLSLSDRRRGIRTILRLGTRPAAPVCVAAVAVTYDSFQPTSNGRI
ncbi:hypothetical protein JCM17961_17740 [Endothiovibrio diazotrophicus]